MHLLAITFRRVQLALLGLFLSLVFSAHANVIQYFSGISYNNPAELIKVNKDTVLFGSTGSYADLRFKGSVLNLNSFQYDYGKAYSKTYVVMPYGRLAHRLNKKTVIGLDVTEPFNSNLNWGTNSFTRYANTQNLLTDVDLSPKIAYAFTQKFQMGAGINFNFLANNEVNFAIPTGQFTYANMINPTSSFGIGFNVGATYMVDKQDFLGLTYYSRIRQNTRGTSRLGPLLNPNLNLSFYMPTTIIASYVHLFNEKWLMALTGFRTQWSLNQYLYLNNTAVPAPMSNFIFHMGFNNSYAALAAVRRQVTKDWGLTLAGMRDGGPERASLRSITFPSYPQYFVGLIGDYHFNKVTSVEILYGHVYSGPAIENHININSNILPFTTGAVTINADVLDLRLKIEA